jgi:predicted DNA-binding protein
MKTSLFIPEKMAEKLDKASNNTGLSKSEIIRAGILQKLKENGFWSNTSR